MGNFPFVGQSHEARSKSFDAQRCINLYPEVSQSGSSKYVSALIGTPGLSLWATAGSGPVRGMIPVSAQFSLVASGGKVYRVSSAGEVLELGNIDYGSGPVSMSSNGNVVMMVTGGGGYVISLSDWSVSQIMDEDFHGADRVDFIDGYFVFNWPGTGKFQLSSLYDTTIDGLDFATAEGSPDLLVSLIVDHRELWLFGEKTSEVWFNSGDSSFPFSRIQGAFIEHGCAAKHSTCKMDNSVFWIGSDDKGSGIVLRAQGYVPQRISTHAVEYAIGKMERIDDAVGWTYQQDGHSFYVLTFPSASSTWCYDASTNMWHERAWLNPETGVMGAHRGACHMVMGRNNIVGDRENGNLYRLDLETYSDNGDQIPKIRVCPHLVNDTKRGLVSAFQVDMETGVGLSEGQGSDPQAMLQWSDDGGFTWSSEMWASIGKIGERKARVRWRRLGKSRDRVFKVTITDPIKVVIVGASIEAQGCAS